MSIGQIVYVYIAANKEGGRSYVDVSRSLQEMDWIVKYGVDNLVWFEVDLYRFGAGHLVH